MESQPAGKSFARVTALREAGPATLNQFSWLAGGTSTQPAGMSLPLHGCLRDLLAGEALSAMELLQTFLTY